MENALSVAGIWIFVTACSVVFTVLLVGGITLALKSNRFYKLGVEKAINSPAVAALIGSPVKPALLVGGGIKNAATDHGFVNLRTKLKGTRRNGKLRILARNYGGSWRLETLSFTAGGDVVDLLKEE